MDIKSFKYLLVLAFWFINLNCDCPPIGHSLEDIQAKIQQADHIVVAEVIEVDFKMACFDFKVVETIKGRLKVGEVKTGQLTNCGGGEQIGPWLFFLNGENQFVVAQSCNYSFFIDKPNFPGLHLPKKEKGHVIHLSQEERNRQNQELANEIWRSLGLLPRRR